MIHRSLSAGTAFARIQKTYDQSQLFLINVVIYNEASLFNVYEDQDRYA